MKSIQMISLLAYLFFIGCKKSPVEGSTATTTTPTTTDYTCTCTYGFQNRPDTLTGTTILACPSVMRVLFVAAIQR